MIEKQDYSKLSNEELIKQLSLKDQQSKLKDNLIAILSHDLKGYLSKIEGLIIVGKMYDNIGEYIPLIETQIKGANNLLIDMITRFRSGFDFQLHNLNNIIDQSIDAIQSDLNVKGIKIQSNINSDDTIYCDIVSTIRIMHNLLTNAIKYTDKDKGQIMISSQNLGAYTKISINDNGIGIAPQNIDKILGVDKPFQKTGTSGEETNGLGLNFCNELIIKSGGNMSVESDGEGQGSTFSFTIPNSKQDS